METFTPVAAAVGGLLIGLSAGLLWLFNGRLAGISGIFGGLTLASGNVAWRLVFIGGLIVGATAGFHAAPGLFAGVGSDRPVLGLTPLAAIAAGAAVGIGTRLAGGCTSGHGICGLARLSRRSAVAVGVFMATAIAVVFIQRHLLP